MTPTSTSKMKQPDDVICYLISETFLTHHADDYNYDDRRLEKRYKRKIMIARTREKKTQEKREK